jgi:prepilin-type N-terminal cleavage/methylation domain-containing protein
MSKSRGFTIVELVIVIIIMGILLVLGVVNVTSSQANARDKEREADTGTIVKGLETRYNRGNPVVSASYVKSGSYPSVNEILHAEGKNPDAANLPNTGTIYITDLLPGTDTNSFYPPNTGKPTDMATTFKVICSTSCSTMNAEDPTQISAALGGSKSVYVYEPITAANQVCINSICVRYNLYYLEETVAGTQTKASLRQ